jgi:F-type H+-transporting ATPase subunit delta
MNQPLNKDARGFVDEVVTYMKGDRRSKSSLPKVQLLLGKVTAQAKKEKLARVESSVVLTAEEKKTIKNMLEKLIGHEVQLECIVTPDVIGGLRIQVADWIVDTTLKTQLSQLSGLLTQ